MGSILGPGIATVEGKMVPVIFPLYHWTDRYSMTGEEHRRQRHILNPAFAVGQLRTFLGLFQMEGEKVCRLNASLHGWEVLIDVPSSLRNWDPISPEKALSLTYFPTLRNQHLTCWVSVRLLHSFL